MLIYLYRFSATTLCDGLSISLAVLESYYVAVKLRLYNMTDLNTQ